MQKFLSGKHVYKVENLYEKTNKNRKNYNNNSKKKKKKTDEKLNLLFPRRCTSV